MISIVYCTRESKPTHKEHLFKTCGGHKDVEIIEIINNGESLTKSYNRGLNKAKHNVVVFCHDDLEIKTKQWGPKLLKQFEANPEYAIIGVAGSKYMPISGQWWEKLDSTVYGRVDHTVPEINNGKTYTSTYGPDQAKRLEEVINVDGVWFAVHKDRIKETFDETVEGFHFYDVDFSFRNHLAGAKVGVTTLIRINHFSAGATNEQWEENRKIFAEKYADKLPIKLPETYENRKLRVLLGCLNFQGLTGSEISTLETAKGLAKRGCDVSVISGTVSPHFQRECKKLGIKTYLMSEPPGYKMGDGQWQLNTSQGLQISKPNVLYTIARVSFDVIHANHTPITEQLLKLYPTAKFVNVVRSEVIDLENPVIDERIKKYVAIRPSIKDYMMQVYDIEEDMIEVIYNPFDKNRFKPKSLPSGIDKKVTLFVGTMDYLRQESISDLISRCADDDKELWLVGKDTNGYGKLFAEENEHVKYFPPTDKIEEFFYKCDETAGIFLGRTTIEGFLCGKPAIIYKVNKSGGMIDCEYHEVPENLSLFDIDNVINQYKELYIDVANTF